MSFFGNSKQGAKQTKESGKRPFSVKNLFGKGRDDTGQLVKVNEGDGIEAEVTRAPKPKKEPKPKKADVERAEFGLKILYDSDDAEVDIIAVHGLNGHRERTFTADNEVCWLKSLLPGLFKNMRVITYGYDARTHSSSPLSSEHLLGHAEDFIETLTMERTLTETNKRPIIFVAHSLGGLIVKSALNLSASRNKSHKETQRAIMVSTYGILFIGTPHRGSEGASWAKLALNFASVAQHTNQEIVGHLEQNSEWLENQQTMFLPISSHFDTTYFYERYPTMIAGRPVTVVPKHSAYLGLSDAGVMGINSDHLDMVKYRDAEDEGFKRVGGTLRIMLKKAPGKITENWQVEEAIKDIGKAQKISYEIPMKLPFSKNHNFTGRNKELLQMQEILQDITSAPQMRIAVLYGLGGMGKSQLANEYAYLHGKDYTSIWWVNAKTTETLSQSFFGITQELITHHARIRVNTGQKPDYAWIATALALPVDAVNDQGQLMLSPDSYPIQIFIEAAKSWLAIEENRQWLLIIDNYDDLENVDIRDFLSTNSSGSVIITTRAADARRLGRSVEVAAVGLDDAMEILRKSAQTETVDFDQERSDAIAIIEKVDALPLALDQAGAYISAMQIPYSEYIRRYDARFAQIAARKPSTAVWQYREDTVFTTWEISFNQLGDAAKELLTLCGFLDNEDVWEGLFPVEIVKENFGTESLDYAIREIFALSLAKRKNRAVGDSFWIHPMVHKWSYERLSASEKEIKALSAISLTSAAVSCGDDRSSPVHLALERKLIPHILMCFNHICRNRCLGPVRSDFEHLQEVKTLQQVLLYHWKLTEAEGLTKWILAGFEKGLGKDHTQTLGTVASMASVLEKQGNSSDALEWLGRALTGFEEARGKDHRSTLAIVQNMASVLDTQGKYDDALEWYRRALTGKEKDPDDSSTLMTIQNMASVLVKQGKYDDALEFYRRALAGEEKALGKDSLHTNILAITSNIAWVFYMQGNYEEALEWFERALTGREKTQGNDHPSTLSVVNNIASVLDKQGKYSEALEWFRRALAGYEKSLGKCHPKTLGVINNMALLLDKQGKHDDALEWFRRALVMREKTLGKDHLDTLTTANNMASVLDIQGNHEEALELYRRALSGREKDLGGDHPSTLITVNNIASSFLRQAKYEDALKWFERARIGEEKTLGKDHPSTLTAAHNIASVLDKKGKYDDALKIFGQVLHGRERVLGKSHPDTLSTMNNMASVLERRGLYSGALVWYKKALAEKVKTLGKDHPSTLTTVNNIASVFSAQGKYSNALEWFQQVLVGLEKALGKDHPKTIKVLKNIALVYDKQGKCDDALEWFRWVLVREERVQGSDHPETLITVNNIASVLDAQGKHEDALELYRRALAGFENTLGKDHPSTLTTVNNMASVFDKQGKHDDALEWFDVALVGREKALGKDHPDSIATRNSIMTLKKRLLVADTTGIWRMEDSLNCPVSSQVFQGPAVEFTGEILR